MPYDVAALRQAEFPWAPERIYLDHAAIGPLPARTLAVTDAYNRDRSMPWRLGARNADIRDYGDRATSAA